MNAAWRKVNQFLAVSGEGKQQSALGTALLDADLDTRDKCDIEERNVVDRTQEYNCDDVDLVEEPIRRRSKEFRFTYTKVTAQILARWLAYYLGSAAAPTGSNTNEVKTLTRSGTVSGGTFTLSLTLEGRTGTTGAIAYNCSTATLQAALYDAAHSIGRIIKKGDVTVTGDWTSGMVVTFGGRLADANIPAFTVGNGSITGGGTVVSAETTNGASKYHAITRSTDQSKPLFSFAFGDKNGSVAQQKYKDAVVTNMQITTSADQPNVQLVVTVACNYNGEDLSGFSVPACVNITALKVYDCRLSVNSVWESSNLVNLNVDLNDQVPIEGAFVYDDLDPSAEWERGDKPTQEITWEEYGDSSAATYVLANTEISQDPVEVLIHFGNPGDRATINAPDTKIKFQDNPIGFAGSLNKSTFKIAATPYGTSGDPFSVDAYISQTATFLDS